MAHQPSRPPAVPGQRTPAPHVQACMARTAQAKLAVQPNPDRRAAPPPPVAPARRPVPPPAAPGRTAAQPRPLPAPGPVRPAAPHVHAALQARLAPPPPPRPAPPQVPDRPAHRAPAPVRPGPVQAKLAIAGDPAFTTAIRNALDQLSGNRLGYTTETMIKIRGIRIPWPNWTLVRLRANANGLALSSTRLLARLIASPRTVKIQATTGHTRAAPTVPFYSSVAATLARAGNGTGTDVDVFINPADLANAQATVIDPATGRDQTEGTPAGIVIGHELIHADRFTRGVGGFNAQGQMPPGSFRKTDGRGATLALEEIYTVGLPVNDATPPNPDQLAISENDLRLQYGRNRRTHYP